MQKPVTIVLDETLIDEIHSIKPYGMKKQAHYENLLKDGILYRALACEPENEKKIRGVE